MLANEFSAIATNDIKALDNDVDLNIVSISDGAISDILNELDKTVKVVHTSGSISIDAFKSFQNCGILYPLQTFTKGREIAISSIPFFVEANNDKFQEEILVFCKQFLSSNCHFANSQVREDMHLAAVVSSNFLTYLLHEAQSILTKRNLPLNILEELLKETINKSMDIGPLKAQTGPAKRKDQSVIETQMNKLENKEFKEVYRLITDLIIKSQSNV